MKTMYELFMGWTGRPVHKWHHYLDIYERYFSPMRGKSITLLEIGLGEGGSLDLWREYFGPQVRIVGIDINPRCKAYESDGVDVFIGDQSDPSFLREVLRQVPEFDIIVDDGGHTAGQQISSFETLYPRLSASGVYVVEDTHTSYWDKYKDRADHQTFVEYAKHLCDLLTAWHFDPASFARFAIAPEQRVGEVDVPWFTRCTRCVSFYDSMVIFEKAQIVAPQHSRRTGQVGAP